LTQRGIGTSVHFIPAHFHPYYGERLGLSRGALPKAEAAYEGAVSLPLYPAMSEKDVEDVIGAVRETVLAARLASTEFVLAEKAPSVAFRAPSASEGKDSAFRTNYDYNHA